MCVGGLVQQQDQECNLIVKFDLVSFIKYLQRQISMDSYPKLTVVESSPQKILISFLYSVFNVLIGDTIALFVERGTGPLATVTVGNPSGHWSQGSFKVGQVVLDISAVTFCVNNRYILYYVSQGSNRSSCALTWNSKQGILTEQKIGEEPTELQDYTYVSATTSIETSSFESPTASPQPSSSFVVVTDCDSTPQVPEELFVSTEDSDCQSQPDDFEESPDPFSSHSNYIPANSEVCSPMQDDTSESTETQNEVSSTVTKTPESADILSARQSVMSVSVNWDNRVMSQGELQLLKSNNKDLHQKLRQQTKIMEKMQSKLDQAKSGDSNEMSEKTHQLEYQYKHQIDSLEIEMAEVKSQLERAQLDVQKLKEDKKASKKKINQLTIEKNTHFERNATLLNELQDKEKEMEVLRSENMVLQEKLRRRTEKQQQEPVKRKKLIQNGHDTRPPPSRPLLDLASTGEGKLKSPPPPHESKTRLRAGVEKVHQPPLDKPSTRQPPPRSSPKRKHEAQMRDNPPITAKPSYSGQLQRANEVTISEPRVDDIANSMRGTPTIVCPVCQKSLSARENDYGVLLHVEQCLQNT